MVLDGYFADYRYLTDSLEEVKVAFKKLTKRKEISYDIHVAVYIGRLDYTQIMCLDQINKKMKWLKVNYFVRKLVKEKFIIELFIN